MGNKENEIMCRTRMAQKFFEGLPLFTRKYARYCWLSLPKPWTGLKFRSKAAEKGVLVASTESFIMGSQSYEDGVLISLSYEPSRSLLETALLLLRDILL